jgi:uncharacterized membrane protein
MTAHGRRRTARTGRVVRRVVVAACVALMAAACERRAADDDVPPRVLRLDDTLVAPPLTPADTFTPEYDSPAARAIWDEARQRGVWFRALGQEPGWFLEIFEGDRIVFVTDYGEREVVMPAPEPDRRPETRSTMYRVRTVEHTLTVLLVEEPCYDTMSGEPFSTTVTVTLDGAEYQGCGRVP